ncbi:FMN-binding negative transcriptional regulator [Diaphorobacter aerolatus]|uniref:FMN-binding negative transcriptional regulator n=1 Tax=Diaphorobacter aerolatus TaxID=1288495 RepID=A0A7H0GJ41_9BURK|nr:FMN-binding negative transcriptional regulator [Diaphorobacter aerolatus]
MYNPAHFAENRPEELQRVIREHPLGILVTQGGEGLDADHLPFEFDPTIGEHGQLIGHVARANPVWQRCPTGTPVMVIFRGAEAYVSPNWYPSKHETHRLVPTWNYEVVHAHGVMTVRDDERFVRRVVALLTRRHEAAEPKPWKMGDSAPELINGLLQNIVGIEIAITSLVGKFKLSQNREPRDIGGAADTLQERGGKNSPNACARRDSRARSPRLAGRTNPCTDRATGFSAPCPWCCAAVRWR